MTRYFCFSLLFVLLILVPSELFSQYKLPFGDISPEQLSNKLYKPDPGADAVVISDIAVATLNFVSELYVEMERDVRIRIVNSSGFDYADIEIPFLADDRISNFRASTFNTRNGEKTEIKIPKNSFIIEKVNKSYRSLKFNFPDVHEGSVIEYSYIIKLYNNSVSNLIPWMFQADIPVMLSSLKVAYPDVFQYKFMLSGSSSDIQTTMSEENSMFLNDPVMTKIITWTAMNIPAFRDEPHILGSKEHMTKLSFELANINFPKLASIEINPSYSTLTEKLLERDDFGTPLDTQLKSLAEEVTRDQKDNLSKLKKIHEYISTNIFWNGENDFTASSSLRKVLKKGKGNSADINMILIVLARAAGISAEPVILSTRSNGTLNTFFAMIQQFDYLVARISADGKVFLVDATDPIRPFDLLPFNCLNKTGRLISKTDSKFVDLKNDERYYDSYNLVINPDPVGNITGTIENVYSGYSAYDIRKMVKLESQEGYLDILRSLYPNAEINDFKVKNLADLSSDLSESFSFKLINGSQVTSDEIILNPYQLGTSVVNPFYSAERKFPVDFGCPIVENYEMALIIPDGYQVSAKPENSRLVLGKDGGSFEYECQKSGNILKIKSSLSIDKTQFPSTEYKEIQKFFLKIQEKQAEFVILKKN